VSLSTSSALRFGVLRQFRLGLRLARPACGGSAAPLRGIRPPARDAGRRLRRRCVGPAARHPEKLALLGTLRCSLRAAAAGAPAPGPERAGPIDRPRSVRPCGPDFPRSVPLLGCALRAAGRIPRIGEATAQAFHHSLRTHRFAQLGGGRACGVRGCDRRDDSGSPRRMHVKNELTGTRWMTSVGRPGAWTGERTPGPRAPRTWHRTPALPNEGRQTRTTARRRKPTAWEIAA
jgi:hypothetical protein